MQLFTLQYLPSTTSARVCCFGQHSRMPPLPWIPVSWQATGTACEGLGTNDACETATSPTYRGQTVLHFMPTPGYCAKVEILMALLNMQQAVEHQACTLAAAVLWHWLVCRRAQCEPYSLKEYQSELLGFELAPGAVSQQHVFEAAAPAICSWRKAAEGMPAVNHSNNAL
jgi:hypothetical protein